MMAPRLDSRRSFTAAAVLAATAGALAVYFGQIDTGLYYDDYHFLRPVHPLEIRRVWYGSWDPTGIESPFFRPLTAWLFGLRFWLFGLNTQALHGISVAGHVLCATLVSWFLRREHVTASVCLLAAWVYAIHPLFPYAQVSWLTNQMHLATSLVVLITLLVWQQVRDRSALWLLVLLPPSALAFLIKEDAIMLLPVIVTLTLLRAWLVAPAGRAGAAMFVPTAAVFAAALVLFRQSRLGRIGGYGVPAVDQALAQFWKGLDQSLLLWPTRTPWQAVAATVAMAALMTALVRARNAGTVVRVIWCGALAALALTLPALLYDVEYRLITWQGISSGVVIAATLTGAGLARARLHGPWLTMMTGAIITILFNLPFALVSKREQYHLLALGCTILLAGAVDAIRQSTQTASRRVMAAALVASLPLALLARTQAAAFRPCSGAVLSTDGEAAGWWVLPGELREWLEAKKARCEAGGPAGHVSELPIVSWGLHERASEPGGEVYQWTSDRVTLLIRPDVRSISLAFRRPDASPASPVRVQVAGGTAPAEVRLSSGEWHYVTVRPPRTLLNRMRSASRLDISITPWFVPAARDPRESDLRRFGAQFRVVEH